MGGGLWGGMSAVGCGYRPTNNVDRKGGQVVDRDPFFNLKSGNANMKKSILPAVAGANLLLLTGAAFSDAQEYVDVTLIGIADTLIQEDVDAPASSEARGTQGSLDVGMYDGRRQRMLVRFDLSSIPEGAQIVSAQLRLRRLSRKGYAGADVADKNTYVFRMLREWSETGASWNWSRLDQTQWEAPGAVGPSDRASGHTGDGDPTETTFSHWDVTPDVQMLVDGMAGNLGWMVKGPESDTVPTIYTRFASREWDTFSESIWPTLLITYQEPSGSFDFDAWREMHFTAEELDDPSISGPEADPAGDGVPNLLKYAFGLLNPRETARDALPVISHSHGELRLTYTRAKDLPDVNLVVEISADLEAWDSGPEHVESVEVVNEGETERVTVRPVSLNESAGRVFFRTRAVLP